MLYCVIHMWNIIANWPFVDMDWIIYKFSWNQRNVWCYLG